MSHLQGHTVTGVADPERGSLSLETSIILGPMLLLLLLVIQLGIYGHATNVARSAAQVGAQAGRGINASSAAMQQAAAQYVANTGGLLNSHVSTSTGRTVTVTITGTAATIVPLIPMPAVTATASLPKERVTLP